ncbi:SagB/ThcOx family dehydrogenase [Bacillus kwashiorkori]|uniref:SagB/ThcOx family dehydrogenase n=1 Tax=Bacillus kwashiorkori TaxID=1522318 RepID=UPI0007838E7A|nr:SagB/ThcOx family dehydrogenase [Bacillus kwashiorkori]
MKKLREYKTQIKFPFFNPHFLYRFVDEMKLTKDLWEEKRPNHQYEFPTLPQLAEGNRPIPIPSIQDLTKSLDVRSQCFLNRRSYELSEFDSTWTKEELFLWINLAFGVSAEKVLEYTNKNGDVQRITKKLRTYPSGGAMLPIEIHLYIKDILGIQEGLYRYVGDQQNLELYQEKCSLEDLDNLSPLTCLNLEGTFSFKNTKILTFLVGNYQWSFAKYGLLSYRLAMIEAGHIGQNIQLVATLLKKKSLPMCAFYDDKVEDFLNITENNRNCIYMIALG